MAESEETVEDTPKKKSKLPLILGVVLALVGGAGAFFFVSSSGSTEKPKEEEGPVVPELTQNISFLELDPILIPIGSGSAIRTLRFQAHLELDKAVVEQVSGLKPRILDVLNTYLRAVELETLEDRRALLRLRAQMLRRVQVVTHEVPIRDLLITEFIVN